MGKHATGEMSFAPGTVASLSNQTQQSKEKAIGMEEHVGDTEEAYDDGSDVDIKSLGAKESQFPLRSVHSSRKWKSKGRRSSGVKRMDEKDYQTDEEDCTMDEEEDRAIDTIVVYTIVVYTPEYFHVERPHSMLKERLPWKLHVHREGFTERGHFVKSVEIVTITLFILARGASYREAEDRFQHSPSTIGKSHKQVLDGLVQFQAVLKPG
ncbi:hypothetical protein Cgig2_027454 [Carnegiea gigantea]|uniref:DUF8040 domain-containing protein n=1 Tax=Carnegiea gigantea TaxID=171969 RepID=A0A9Q1KPU0_9CARY|nr:hypothetical protein Cgig2_027454 [Carnegiea gigantea]